MSVSTENFLKNIFLLEQEGREVTSSGLAQCLNVSAAAVSDMAGRLEQKGLIDHQPYGAFHLSAAGRRWALQVVRRHRIWELFLSRVLGMDLLSVHEEAERLEHHTSEKLVEQMYQFLGEPAFDPHGDPIPDQRGILPDEEHLAALNALPPRAACVVKQLRYRDAETSEMYDRYGIKQGMKLSVRKVYGFDGSVEVDTEEGENIVISAQLASSIYCAQRAVD